MSDYIMTFLKPDYYKDFACTGQDCRSNCCSYKWNIPVDKKTYKKYQKIKDVNLSKKLNDYVKYNKQGESTLEYGYIKQLEDNNCCAFQTKEGLCEIHQKLGSDYLCNTCDKYPRVYSKFNNNIECGLCVSCEALGEILLKKKDMIMFETDQNIVDINTLKKEVSVINNNMKDENIINNYPLIKATSIAILQNRDYCIDDRLCHLLFFLKKLDEYIKSNLFDQISSLCENIIYMIENKELDKLTDIKVDLNYQMNICFMILAGYSFKDETNPNEIINKICDAYGGTFTVDVKDEKYVVNKKYLPIYEQSLKDYYSYIKDKDHFIENILVNEFHSKMMPFYRGFDVFESALYICLYYVTMRMAVGSYLQNHKNMSDTELIDIFAIYGKRMLHSDDSFNFVLKFLKQSNNSNLQNIIMLIKP
ncbi:MAG: flagellin lysine-N-methylase [Oscillospiraceae bacterium]